MGVQPCAYFSLARETGGLVKGFSFSIGTAHARLVKESRSSCSTLRREDGICVPIKTCGTVVQLLEVAPVPLPDSILQIVRMTHCGTYDNIPHVCCSAASITPQAIAVLNVVTTAPQSGIAILAATPCGNNDIDRIANGEDANLSEYPWMALLVYDDGKSTSTGCGGSLITEQYVLSAAHCILTDSKLVRVRLGEHDTKDTIDCTGTGRRRRCAPPVQEIDVEETIHHPEFSTSKFSNDIGLIRLSKRATFKTNVQPVCLPITDASKEATIDRMIIAGWGHIETGIRASVLQRAVVPLVQNEQCQQFFRLIRLSDKQFCAGGENAVDTCRGDSGGPIFFTARYRGGVRWIQYGVVSGGSSQCGTNFSTIFTKVISYLPWIADNIKS